MGKKSSQAAKLEAQLLRAVLDARTHYDTLGVATTAGLAEIKQAHRELASHFHPDRCEAESAHDVMSKVNQAYSCLSDPAARAKYDALNKIATQPCWRCGGSGEVGVSKGKGFAAKKVRVTCPSCGGSGRIAQSK